MGGPAILEERLARRYAWLEDPEQVLEVGKDLLLAVGVQSSTVDLLEEVMGNHRALAHLQQVTGGGVDVEIGRLADLSPDELDTTLTMFENVHSLASAVLARLDALKVRTAIVGIPDAEVHSLLDRLATTMDSEAWRTRDGHGVDRETAWFDAVDGAVSAGGEVAPATSAEITTIVGVLKAMPRTSLKKITPVTSSIALKLMLTGLLKAMATDATAPTETVNHDPDPVVTVITVDPDAAAERDEGAAHAPDDVRPRVSASRILPYAMWVVVLYAGGMLVHLLNHEVHHFIHWRLTLVPTLAWGFVIAAGLVALLGARQVLRTTHGPGPNQLGTQVVAMVAGAFFAIVIWLERSYRDVFAVPVMSRFPPAGLTAILIVAGFAPMVATTAALLVARRRARAATADFDRT